MLFTSTSIACFKSAQSRVAIRLPVKGDKCAVTDMGRSWAAAAVQLQVWLLTGG